MNYYSGMGIRSSIFRCVLSKHLYTPLCSHIHLRACIFSSAMAEPRWLPTQGWLFVVWPYSLVEVHFPRALATLAIKSSYSLLQLASLQVLLRWRGIHISFRGKFQDSILFIQPISMHIFPRQRQTKMVIDSGVAIQCTFSSLMAEPRWSLTQGWLFSSWPHLRQAEGPAEGRFSAKPNIFAEQKYVSEANQSAEGKIFKT